MFDRITPVYDVMNRVMTVGLDQRWRRMAAERVVRPGRPRARRLLRHRRSRPRLRSRRRSGDRASTSPSGCSSARARKAPSIEWVHGDLLALPFADGVVRRGHRRASACATSPISSAGFRELAPRAAAAGDVSPASRSRGRRARSSPFFRALVRRSRAPVGKVLPGGEAYTYLPASVRRFPGPEDLATLLAQAGFTEIRWNLLGGGIVALHTATAAEAP